MGWPVQQRQVGRRPGGRWWVSGLLLMGLAADCVAQSSIVPDAGVDSITRKDDTPKHRFIIWFRSDILRVHDNPMLAEAAAYQGPKEVICIYIFDPEVFASKSAFGSRTISAARIRFLVESVTDLRYQLRRLDSQLLVGLGKPEELIPKAVLRDPDTSASFGGNSRIAALFEGRERASTIFEKETTLLYTEQVTPERIAETERVLAAIPSPVRRIPKWVATLYSPSSLPFNVSETPETFVQFVRMLEGEDIFLDDDLAESYRQVQQREPGPPATATNWWKEVAHMLPAPGRGHLPLPAKSTLQLPRDGSLGFDVMPEMPKAQGPPAWRRITAEWGLDPVWATTYTGGERAGLGKLANYHVECINYELGQSNPKLNSPNIPSSFAPWLSFLPNVLSTKMSPWLANGALSPRRVLRDIHTDSDKGIPFERRHMILFELLARDYHKLICLKHGTKLFAEGGPHDGELGDNFVEALFEEEGPLVYHREDADGMYDPILIERWKAGRTGYPVIDANMRELAQTGYMSFRGRQLAASYFVIDMGQDWRRGADYFQSMLIDYDPCTNWHNWAQLAGRSGEEELPRFVAEHEGKRYDKRGHYVRYWLPELSKVPPELVQTPWRMNSTQQEEYGVKIINYAYASGEADYPYPAEQRIDLYPREEGELPHGKGPDWGTGRRRELVVEASSEASSEVSSEASAHFWRAPDKVIAQHSAPFAPLYHPPFEIRDAYSPSFATRDGACAVSVESDEWFRTWVDDLEEWWHGLPMVDQRTLGDCLGAFGLHVGARFDAAYRAWRKPKMTPPLKPRAEAARRDDCPPFDEWAAYPARVLPEFPEFPSSFELKMPAVPIPRLLPHWKRLQSLQGPTLSQAAPGSSGVGSSTPQVSLRRGDAQPGRVQQDHILPQLEGGEGDKLLAHSILYPCFVDGEPWACENTSIPNPHTHSYAPEHAVPVATRTNGWTTSPLAVGAGGFAAGGAAMASLAAALHWRRRGRQQGASSGRLQLRALPLHRPSGGALFSS